MGPRTLRDDRHLRPHGQLLVHARRIRRGASLPPRTRCQRRPVHAHHARAVDAAIHADGLDSAAAHVRSTRDVGHLARLAAPLLDAYPGVAAATNWSILVLRPAALPPAYAADGAAGFPRDARSYRVHAPAADAHARYDGLRYRRRCDRLPQQAPVHCVGRCDCGRARWVHCIAAGGLRPDAVQVGQSCGPAPRGVQNQQGGASREVDRWCRHPRAS